MVVLSFQRKYLPRMWRSVSRLSEVRHLCKRCLSTESVNLPETMSAWQTFEYGGPEKLQLSNTTRVPMIQGPKDVLIKIHAASLNPIDVRMLSGYGKTTLNAFRLVQSRGKKKTEFPLVLGKDFSGEVIEVGKAVHRSALKPGDEVWGVVNPMGTLGSHAQYTVTQSNMVTKKPTLLTHNEAASFPYVAMTAWSAIVIAGGLTSKNSRGKRVLIIGGSGGVGTFAVQLLCAWGAEVTVVCSERSEDVVTSLGADIILDYNSTNFKDNLQRLSGYDVILNLVSGDSYEWCTELLKKNTGAKYVTLNFPMLSNNDTYGLPFGFAKTLLDLSFKAVPSLPEGRLYRWALFAPNLEALKTLDKLLHKEQIRPVLESIYPFSEAPAAYEKTGSGRCHGKIVIDVKEDQHENVHQEM